MEPDGIGRYRMVPQRIKRVRSKKSEKNYPSIKTKYDG